MQLKRIHDSRQLAKVGTGNRHRAAEVALTQDAPHRCLALLTLVHIRGSSSMRVQVGSRGAVYYGPLQTCRKRESSHSIAALLGAMCWARRLPPALDLVAK